MGTVKMVVPVRLWSWQLDRRTVSIWTTAGRLAGIRFACSGTQLARLREYRQGESDLVHRDGKWFLYATCDIPGPPLADPAGFLGVDLGIANIATTDDGVRHCGRYLNRQRHRARHLRAKLRQKAPSQLSGYSASGHGRKPGSPLTLTTASRKAS